MKIATFQGPLVFGDPEANLQTTIASLKRAGEQGVEILCMPETYLHGYFRSEQEARANSVDLNGEYFHSVLERVKDFPTTLILGLNELRDGKLFNTMVVIREGKLLGRYSKNYLVFNYFNRGGEFPVFEQRGIPFGVVICADTSYIEPARILAMKGAQIIFTPHFNYINYQNVEDHTWRVRQHQVAIAIDNDVYVARANVVVPESQGSKIFGSAGVGVGDAVILNRRGRVLAEAGLHTHTLLTVDIPDDDLKPKRSRPWQRCSPEMATAMYEQYQEMFGKHANIDDRSANERFNGLG